LINAAILASVVASSTPKSTSPATDGLAFNVIVTSPITIASSAARFLVEVTVTVWYRLLDTYRSNPNAHIEAI
jgi:hypothetical protein